jgi:hypothetical protein
MDTLVCIRGRGGQRRRGVQEWGNFPLRWFGTLRVADRAPWRSRAGNPPAGLQRLVAWYSVGLFASCGLPLPLCSFLWRASPGRGPLLRPPPRLPPVCSLGGRTRAAPTPCRVATRPSWSACWRTRLRSSSALLLQNRPVGPRLPRQVGACPGVGEGSKCVRQLPAPAPAFPCKNLRDATRGRSAPPTHTPRARAWEACRACCGRRVCRPHPRLAGFTLKRPVPSRPRARVHLNPPPSCSRRELDGGAENPAV